MVWIEQLQHLMVPMTAYSLPAVKKLMNVERKDWKALNAELKRALTKGVLTKTGGSFILPSSSTSPSSSSSSSSSGGVSVLKEVSLEERLENGSKTAIDLTKTRFQIDTEKVNSLKAKLVNVETSRAAVSLVKQITNVVAASSYLLLKPSIFRRLQIMLQSIVTDELTAVFGALSDQCQLKIKSKQREHRMLTQQFRKRVQTARFQKNERSGLKAKISKTRGAMKKAQEELERAKQEVLEKQSAINAFESELNGTAIELAKVNSHLIPLEDSIEECNKEKRKVAEQLTMANCWENLLFRWPFPPQQYVMK
jgi:hypothetical protein